MVRVDSGWDKIPEAGWTGDLAKMPNNHWTNRKVAELKGKTLYPLGNNLCVRAKSRKSDARKYYVFIYRPRIGNRLGKKNELSFGRTDKLDIKDAQEWARKQLSLIAHKTDPKNHEKETWETAEKVALTHKTFREMTEIYVAKRTNPKDPKRWVPSTAEQMSRIKDRILATDIAEVHVDNPELVQLKGVEIIKSVAARRLPTRGGAHTGREEAPVMAARFRDFLKGTMGQAKSLHCYSGENPFSEEAGIDDLAPIPHTSKPHPGWHHRDLPRLYQLLLAAENECEHGGLWTTAQAAKAIGRDRAAVLGAISRGLLSAKQANNGKTASYLIDPAELQKRYPIINPNAEPNFGEGRLALPLLRLIMLTGVRFSEANEMPRDEINWPDKIWIIPPDRTKKLIEHVIPLSPPAYEILRRQQARKIDSRYVFARGPTLTGVDYHLGNPLTDLVCPQASAQGQRRPVHHST